MDVPKNYLRLSILAPAENARLWHRDFAQHDTTLRDDTQDELETTPRPMEKHPATNLVKHLIGGRAALLALMTVRPAARH